VKKTKYILLDETIEQPVSRTEPARGNFTERVKLLIPADVSERPKVLFVMGYETALEDATLTVLFKAYGERKDLVILCGEHRGYGRSIAGADQTVPGYVCAAEALADYHAIRLKYAQQFPGPWMIAGYSYGGGLSISYAHTYPEDGAVVLSSSGVVDWNALLPEYDLAVRENLGSWFYERLCRHVDHLTPAEPFSENWYGREIIYAFVTGLSQYRQFQSLRGLVAALTLLPTRAFIGVLKRLDAWFAANGANQYADSNCALTLSNEQALTCAYGWRVWRYQQAFECGTYWAPSGPRSIYRRSAADWEEESRLLFGREATVFEHADWKVRELVDKLKIPLVYVRGEKDPWRRVGLEKEYAMKNGRMMSFDRGFHCPDRSPADGIQVIEAMLKYVDEGA
jgi:pimeloyl-ACP methyl ester carboxylesterase